jgi:D-alanyl-D-alanine endopeptidase (penicillin-binding protein 7)
MAVGYRFRNACRSLAGFLIALCVGATPALSVQASTSQKAASGKPAKPSKSAKPAKTAKTATPPARAAKSSKAAKPVKAPARANARGQARAVAGNGLRAPKRRTAVRLAPPPRPSFGQIYGLHATDDELDLKSSVALVVDQDTNEVLFSKNPEAVLPIASITKLMTALVVTEAGLPLHEALTVDRDDVDATAGSRSRLQMGTELSRGEMLHLSLMASENRAAHVLGRTYPGGMQAFVAAMNRKARELGMRDTRYVEPTGLSSENQSSARDLTQLVRAAMAHPIIRELSTSLEASVPVGSKQVQFRNTNGLVRNPEWEIGLQKTGYIAAAGRCVVMQAELAGRKLIMVLLDSAGKYSRIGDAERLRKWIADTQLVPSLETAAPVVPVSAGFPSGLAPVQPR